jgi:MFS family permease
MEPQVSSPAGESERFWSGPFSWCARHNFSRNFWIYFFAVFFFDAGFGIYFFLFNLYLLDLHFDERMMGWVGGAMTLGSVLALLPAGALSKRIGVKPLIVFCFVASPLVCAIRTMWMWMPAQVGLAILAGMTMSAGTVCYLPTVARLTNEETRTTAFSLIISAGLATAAIGGLVCGYLPQWLRSLGFTIGAADVKRFILLASCGIVWLGLLPVLRVKIPEPPADDTTAIGFGSWRKEWTLSPFLWRFLALMAVWSVVLASFTPFGNVYLATNLHVSMVRIGIIFSTVQMIQLCMGAATPIVFRVLGTIKGVIAIQATAGIVLAILAVTHDAKLAIPVYLIFSAVQWMSSPGLYTLLMSRTPDGQRNTAAALTLFFNSIASSLATMGAGQLFTRFGYPRVLSGIAGLALTAALLVWLLMMPQRREEMVFQQAASTIET